MATKIFSETPYPKPGNSEAFVVAWTLANGDDGDPKALFGYNERTVQVTGTFGGATVVLEGTVDGTNYFTLRDPGSVALSFTAAGGKTVLEAVVKVRPRVTGGDGTTIVIVTLLVSRTKK